MVLISPVHSSQDVPAHPARLQPVQPADHPVKRGLAALVHPVGIVQVARSVGGDPDKEVVLGKKGRPLVVDEGAVGLHRVFDPLTGPHQLGDQIHSPPEEVLAHHRRLTPLPRHCHLRAGMGLQQLPQVQGQQVVAHPELTARVQLLLRQEEAVGAVQIADCPGRLGEHMEGRRRTRDIAGTRTGQTRRTREPEIDGSHRPSLRPDTPQDLITWG